MSYRVAIINNLPKIEEVEGGCYATWEDAKAAASDDLEQTIEECQALLGRLSRCVNFAQYSLASVEPN